MKRRLFIAVNLDSQARAAVSKTEQDIEDAFGWERGDWIRFMPEENWHITVSFLGTQDDAALTAIMNAMRGTAGRFSAVGISFVEVIYAPQKGDPRMIWLGTSEETDHALGGIKMSLENDLGAAGIRFERELRAFSGHITLARFSHHAQPGDLPKIERKLAISCAGTSLDLMESELGRGGAQYAVLQKFPFSEA
jgi:2'-5' RNA ligase